MLPNAGQGACQAFEDAYILARWLDAMRDVPIEAFRNFRRVRIPRVHAVQRLSAANARFKHMRDAKVQKALIDSGKGSVQGNVEWVRSFDPVAEWDKMATVPTIEVRAD
jgi:salicylate hydroxylase